MFLPSYFCLMVLTLAIILIFISILPHGSHPGRRTHTPLHGSHSGNLQKASPSTCSASRFSTLANSNRSYFKDFDKYISLSLSLSLYFSSSTTSSLAALSNERNCLDSTIYSSRRICSYSSTNLHRCESTSNRSTHRSLRCGEAVRIIHLHCCSFLQVSKSSDYDLPAAICILH